MKKLIWLTNCDERCGSIPDRWKIDKWMMIPALIATGVAKVPWKRWLVLIILSDLVIAAIFTPLGFYMASSLLKIQNGLALQRDWIYDFNLSNCFILFSQNSQPIWLSESEDWDENQG